MNMSNVNKSTEVMPGGPDSPVKHKDYLQKTIDTALQYSPDFALKKLNHYDNTVKNIPRAVLEKYDVSRVYQRDHRGLAQSTDKKANFVNLGSSFGPGNRAVLYAAVPKA